MSINPLFTAISEGKLEILRQQLLVNKDVLLNCQDSNGVTALHVAAATGRVEMIRELLRAGAKLEGATARHSTEKDWSGFEGGTPGTIICCWRKSAERRSVIGNPNC